MKWAVNHTALRRAYKLLYPMDECIEWLVNYGCQKFYIYLVKIQIKHLKLPFSLSSIHDQNTIGSTSPSLRGLNPASEAGGGAAPGVYSESWKFMNWLCSIMD